MSQKLVSYWMLFIWCEKWKGHLDLFRVAFSLAG